jgi:hypothetical protein
MAVIAGTIRGLQCVSRSFSGVGSRESWFITADFGAYTGATDTASIVGLGAAIDATARDGLASTLRGGVPALAGADTNKQAVYFTGTAVQALTVSGDNLTGQLSNAAGTEVTSSTDLASELGILVIVDRA